MNARGRIFPQEIAEIVLDHLHSDHATLKLCSLVCRSWLPTCRLHIYRNITLSFRQIAPFESAYEFLSQSPGVLPFFQNFRLTGKHDSVEEKILLGKTFRLLAPTVTSVELLFCQLSIFDNFITLLGSCPALKSLAIVYSHFVDGTMVDLSEIEDGKAVARRVSLTQLQNFQFSGSGFRFAVDWFFLPHSTASIINLRKLSITDVDSHEDVLALQKLLRATRHSLECFDFELDESTQIELDIGTSANLRCLRLLHAVEGAYPVIKPPPWVNSLLSTIRPPNSLERIIIEITAELESSLGASISEWQDLDTTLTQPVFSSLLDVDVRLYCREIPSEENSGLADVLKRQLPLLSAKGILHTYLCSSCLP